MCTVTTQDCAIHKDQRIGTYCFSNHSKMDAIFRGILSSNHPASLKKAFIEKTILPAAQIDETNGDLKCHSIFQITFEVIGKSKDEVDLQLAYLVFQEWTIHHAQHLGQFLSADTVASYLSDESANRHDLLILLETALQQMSNICDNELPALVCAIRSQTSSLMRSDKNLTTIVELLKIFIMFNENFHGKERIMLAKALIWCLSKCDMSDQKGRTLTIENVQMVTDYIGGLWKGMNEVGIKECLAYIYELLSSEEFCPSHCLAALVSFVPETYLEEMTKTMIISSKTTPATFLKVLSRAVDWLSWPYTKNVDIVIINLMKMFESKKNYAVLINVTKSKAEQIFGNLFYPLLRDCSLPVILYMLLSYQHSPNVFHKIIPLVPSLLVKLKEENTESSNEACNHVVELVHTLMQFHSGFPDVYNPVFPVLEEFTIPNITQMKEFMLNTKWGTISSSYMSTALAMQARSETGKVGLINLGNTCYMNSVLQALYMNDEFRNNVLEMSPSIYQILLLKLQHVFAFLTHSQRPAYSPKGFLQASRPSWFEAGRQQDCSEFLRYFFDTMHEQECRHFLNIVSSLPSPGSPGSTGLDEPPDRTCASHVSASGSSGGDFLQCLIHKLFGGQLTVSYKCLNCHEVSVQQESFIDLSLALPECHNESKYIQRKELKAGRAEENMDMKLSDPVCKQDVPSPEPTPNSAILEEELHLQDLIHYYISPEKLEGENRYHCSNCDELQEAQKSISISSAPKYLTLTLLRFAYDTQTNQRVKILRNIIYPEILSVPVTSFNVDKGNECDAMGFSHMYSLHAVVVHSGVSSDCGHYYTYACHSDTLPEHIIADDENSRKGPGSRPWYLFNDNRVTYSDYRTFSHLNQRFAHDTAYLLFYRRITAEDLTQPLATSEPPKVVLRKDLIEAVQQDNISYAQELEEAIRESQKNSSAKSSSHWRDFDDQNPPGSCGDGSGMGGLGSISRFVC